MSNVYTVALRSIDAGGVLYENTFAVKSDPVGVDIAEPSDVEVVNAIKDWLLVPYRNCLAGRYTWSDIVARGILGHDGEATASVGAAGTLAAGTGILPKECVMIVSVKTAHVGRSGRGHFAVPSPGFSSYLADATSWQGFAAYYDNIGAFNAALLAGHTFTYGDLGALSSHLSMQLWSRADDTSRDVTALIRRLPVRWLRSRSTAP
jgi:hypothetical protein